MKLSVITSLLVLLTSEFSLGLASTVNESVNSVYRQNNASVDQSSTHFQFTKNNPPPECCNDGGSR